MRLIMLAPAIVLGLTSWYQPAIDATPDAARATVDVNKLGPTPKHSPSYEDAVLKPLKAAQEAKAKAKAKANAAAAQAKVAVDAQAQLEAAREVQQSQAPSVQVTGNCQDWMAQAGITDIPNATYIVMNESGCNPCSFNPGQHNCSLTAAEIGNHACGLGQQLPCGKWPHAWNDPVGGFIDMQNYVVGRYGSWAGAATYWSVHHNY